MGDQKEMGTRSFFTAAEMPGEASLPRPWTRGINNERSQARGPLEVEVRKPGDVVELLACSRSRAGSQHHPHTKALTAVGFTGRRAETSGKLGEGQITQVLDNS